METFWDENFQKNLIINVLTFCPFKRGWKFYVDVTFDKEKAIRYLTTTFFPSRI